MNGKSPVPAALRRVVTFLRGRQLEPMLIGGLAVRALALPRATYDIDFVVGVDLDDVATFARAAADAGFDVPDAHLRGFADTLAGLRKIAFRVPVDDKSVAVDVFLAATDYQREAYNRRARHDYDGIGVTICSPEDLLLHKLVAHRLRDRSDIADLLLVSGRLDGAYLRRWAEHLGVTQRLDEALRDAGRGD